MLGIQTVQHSVYNSLVNQKSSQQIPSDNYTTGGATSTAKDEDRQWWKISAGSTEYLMSIFHIILERMDDQCVRQDGWGGHWRSCRLLLVLTWPWSSISPHCFAMYTTCAPVVLRISSMPVPLPQTKPQIEPQITM